MRFALVIISLFFFTQCYSQQENQLTQFAYNKSIFNPAFTPFGKSTDISMVYRQQWAGIEGAPSDQIINADIPILTKNIGFGFQMQRSTIGIQEKLDAIIKYAYKIQFDKIAVGFALQGSARRFLNDFTDQRLLAIDGFEMDPSIERIKYSKTIMNIGLGSVIRSDNFYIGISIPRILRSNLDYETEGILTREVRHAYMMIGAEFDFAPDWKFKPQLMYKYAEHSPNDIDLWTEFVYRKQLFLAANLRMGGNPDTLMESVDLVVGFSLNDRWFTSLSIDFTFTELRNYENGSFELMIKYTLAEKN